ncbi:MAG: TasA family protein [Candidatus Heimdallarchaeaceae archaeon]
MNKKIIISLSVIAVVAAVVVGGTIAYFSDTETSTGNTFTAGAIDLRIDSECHYYQNGEPIDCRDAEDLEFGTWELTDLEDGAHKFFAFGDLKPGDYGEDTISLHVYNNDAWACVTLGPLTNDDNGCNEPESEVDGTCGPGEGELGDNLYFKIWADTCRRLGSNFPVVIAPALPGDNIYQPDCDVLLTEGPANGDPLSGVTWTLADSTGNVFDIQGEGPLVGSNDYYLGVGWYIPSDVGNIIQTDSVSGDISFYVEQSRNNPNFKCVEPETTTVQSAVFDFSQTGWAGWSCPSSYPNIISADTTNCTQLLGISEAAKIGSVSGRYPNYPHYTYPSGEEGWAVQNGGTSQSCYIVLTCQAD